MEMTTERRTLLAVLLSMIVMAGWALYTEKTRPKTVPVQPAPASAPAGGTASAPGATPGQVAPLTAAPAATMTATPGPGTAPVQAAAAEEKFVVESELYRVEFSNRGATVRSWQLKKFVDASKPPKVLDLVHEDTAAQTGDWPLAISLLDPKLGELEKQINGGLYAVTSGGTAVMRAPTELVFAWSDGTTRVEKRLKFDGGYVVDVESSVMHQGQALAHAISWRGGFGDATVLKPEAHVKVFFHTEGKVESLDVKNIGVEAQPGERMQQPGGFSYAGIQDQYFAAAFLGAEPGGTVSLWHWKFDRDVTRKGVAAKLPVAEVAVGSTAPGPLALRVFVGPKAFDVLQEMRPPMTELVQFGMLRVVAEPLFRFLQWIHGFVPNYGWAIVLMTIAINMALFPLKVISFRSMRKMQVVAPELKQIQDKYKKYERRDPRRQGMQQEIMAMYKARGVDPTGGCVGGCLPMLMQMPIWFALYQMLGVAIELRHAAWMGWIRDLAQPDPYYILPVIMAVSMFLMQKLTPTPAAMDPAQQRMMKLMPIMFGGMFVVFPVSSGLVLYILTSNVVGIGQQWFLNKTHETDKNTKKKKGKKA